MEPVVSVTIVTYNSARYIDACLSSLRGQDLRPLSLDSDSIEIVVVDNNSSDNTMEILSRHAGDTRIRIVQNRVNNGFCAGQNQAIAASRAAWVLTLNPDVILEPDFLSRLLAVVEAQADPRVGIACGRLSAMQPGLLDSTGIYFTPELRHFDRDCRRPDRGQHGVTEYVFGATGAASLYRREMIDAVSVPGPVNSEFFDEEFFAYREDADLAWRAQLLGWNCLYVPEARGAHARTSVPENRAAMPALVNMHSVKNRFLMRIKNIGAGLYLRNLLPILWRDLCALGYCLTVERSSLPAFAMVVKSWRRTWAKRQWIQSRRQRSDRELAHWFNSHPAAMPAESHANGLAFDPYPLGSRK